MPRLDDDLLPLLDGRRARGAGCPPRSPGGRDAAVCVVLASGGYPGRYDTGLPITGVEEAGRLRRRDGLPRRARRAATARSSPRAAACSACTRSARDLRGAIARAYAAVERIASPGMHPPGHRPAGASVGR